MGSDHPDVLETPKRAGVDLRKYLNDVLTKITGGWPQSRLAERLPHHRAASCRPSNIPKNRAMKKWGCTYRIALVMNPRGSEGRYFQHCAFLPSSHYAAGRVPRMGRSGEESQPWYFTRADGELLLISALKVHNEAGRYMAIITTSPSPDIGGIHDRMSAVLESDMVEPWLFAEWGLTHPLNFVRPAAAGTLRRHPVSKDVGNVRNDWPGLLEPIALEPREGELFDS